MACTTAGKNAVLEALFDGSTTKIALGLATKDDKGNMTGFTEISSDQSVNPRYARMSVYNTSVPSNAGTGSLQTMYVSISNGTVTNINDAAFKDADDEETADSLSVLDTGGWQDPIDSIGIYKNNVLYYAATFRDTPLYVRQGHRVRFAAGSFKVTFAPTETVLDSEAMASELDMISDIQVEE